MGDEIITMRVNRLVIQGGDNTLGVVFHPKLTVIGGVGRIERLGLVNELFGAMNGTRSGVHLEFGDSDGRSLALFRPPMGRHRVIDTDSAKDVTTEFTHDGAVDVLGSVMPDRRRARDLMRLSADDFKTVADCDDTVQRLMQVDQQQLWRAAERLLAAEDHLQSEADAVGSAPEDVEVMERIEASHLAVKRSIVHFERVRKASFVFGGSAGIVGTVLTLVAGVLGLLILLVAAAAAVAAIAFRHRANRALLAEQAALTDAGATSYVGFHLQRVDGLLTTDVHRRRLVDAAQQRRNARRTWTALAGEVTVDFAIKHKHAIDAAVQVQRNVASLEVMSQTSNIAGNEVAELAQVLVQRLAKVRNVGRGVQLPLILDEPFADLDSSIKPLLLELLCSAAGNPQVILLTEDEDVASWARLEAMSGDLSIIEPTPAHEDRRIAIAAG